MARKNDTATTSDSGAEVEVVGRVLTDDDLRAIDTFADALALAEDRFGRITSAADVLGSGFAVIDKERLIGKKFLAVYWRFYLGKWGDCAAVFCVTEKPFAYNDQGTPMHRAIINDGGTGVYQQLTEYTERHGVNGGLLADDGLTRSDYEVEIDGEMKPASTFYVSTAAVAVTEA